MINDDCQESKSFDNQQVCNRIFAYNTYDCKSKHFYLASMSA